MKRRLQVTSSKLQGKGQAIRLRVALILLSLFLSTPLCAQNFDLPEVLVLIEGQPVDSSAFGHEFTWVGDQNGDGYDDLLVSHDPMQQSSDVRRRNRLNRVELFYGSRDMDDEPDFMFTTEDTLFSLGERICYVGNIMPDRNPFVVLQNSLANRRYQETEYHLYFYEMGEALGNEPEFVIRTPYLNEDEIANIESGFGLKYRPTDFNGDGFDDVMLLSSLWLVEEERPESHLLGLWGGADFDTIPDWNSAIIQGGGSISGGYDVNGDGYQDILVQYLSSYQAPSKTISLFLGGNPPDTLPAFTIPYDHFEGLGISDFSLLKDINGDGYDDWGVTFNDDVHWPGDGAYIFFGSEEPDIEPDVRLEGNDMILGGDGRITGGDINGDGYGDVITGKGSARIGDGQINIYLGRPGLPEYKEADMSFDGREDFPYDRYGGIGALINAIGDYNGDGLADFVSRVASRNIAVFEGSHDWRVNVEDTNTPKFYSLSIKAYPNPFNNTVTLKYTISKGGDATLKIYDLSGKEVEVLSDRIMESGDYETVWDGRNYPAGIYIARLIVKDSQAISERLTKLVLVK